MFTEYLARLLPGGRLAALDRSLAVAEFSIDGLLVNANQNFLRIFGYARQDVIGRHHRLFVDPLEAAKPEYAEFWRDLAKGVFRNARYRRIANGGRPIFIQASYSPLLGITGKPRGVLKVATDVTREAERDLDSEGQTDALRRSQAVAEFDVNGRILLANEKFLEAFGYAAKEVIGQHHSMLVPEREASTASYSAFWERLGRGYYQAGEFERIGKDGQPVYIQASYNPIANSEGRIVKIVKVASNVTTEVAGRIARAALQKDVGRDLTVIAGAATDVAREAADAAGRATAVLSDVGVVRSGADRVFKAADAICKTILCSAKVSAKAVAEAEKTSQVVLSLSDRVSRIGDIVATIGDIARKTNLLSLNATIEAARAGEAGRGFTVVAQEVKGLADQTHRATQQIANDIGQVQDATRRAAEAIDLIRETIGNLDEVTRTVGVLLTEQEDAKQVMAAGMMTVTGSARAICERMSLIAKATAHVETSTERVRSVSCAV